MRIEYTHSWNVEYLPLKIELGSSINDFFKDIWCITIVHVYMHIRSRSTPDVHVSKITNTDLS